MASSTTVLSGIKSSLSPALNMVINGKKSAAAFSAAGQAMAELGVAGCIGAACVQQNLLTPDIIRALSKTAFSILLPMFLTTSILKTVATYGLSITSLSVPLLAIAHSFILFQLSKYILLPLFGIQEENDDGSTSFDRSAAVCCSWGNSGVVPLIFAEALFRESGDPTLIAKSYAQISLFLVGWSPFFWSFGRNVLIGDTDDGTINVNNSILTEAEQKKIKVQQRLKSLKRLFPPPVIGVVIGLIIAISPLQHLFISTKTATSATPMANAPLGVVYNGVQNLGRAANPLALLVLTSSLALGAKKRGDSMNTSFKKQQQQQRRRRRRQFDRTTRESPMATSTNRTLSRWLCVSMARFIVSPLLMFGLLNATAKIGMVDRANIEPMLWFILLLTSCMPPAQNSVLMLQVANKSDEATRMAKFLFTLYATSMLPVVVIATVALQVLNLA